MPFKSSISTIANIENIVKALVDKLLGVLLPLIKSLNNQLARCNDFFLGDNLIKINSIGLVRQINLCFF